MCLIACLDLHFPKAKRSEICVNTDYVETN